MSERPYISFKCIEVTQPIGSFYVGAIEARDLVRISYADVRRIKRRDVEEYLGIERELSEGRVAELKEYVKTVDATFPTSVILAIPAENADFDVSKGVMKILDEEDVAKIIDGQHRIAGLEEYAGGSFEVNATIFIEMDLEDQAMVFATINLKQTKVSKSLAYDLFEYAKTRSPQKTCHNIAKLLNQRQGSPLKDKIKILGVATGKPQETITQATFVDRLMKYMTRDPIKDRDDIKRSKKLLRAEGKDSLRLIFRNMFIEGQDAHIAKNIWNYFLGVQERWPKGWAAAQRGLILNRTTGFGALMRFLRPAYLRMRGSTQIVEASQFASLFSKVKIQDNEFTSERFLPGSTGEGALYRFLLESTGLED